MIPQCRLALLLAIYFALGISSVSVVCARFSATINTDEVIRFGPALILVACLALLFAFAKFSFGYLVGFTMYVMVSGYVLISYSTQLAYDHNWARISAVTSLIVFLAPALFLRVRRPPIPSLSIHQMDGVASIMLAVSAISLCASAKYGVNLGNPLESINLREEIVRPALLNYLNGVLTGAALPFTFAYYALRGRWVLASISLILIVLYFPILLNKTVLLAPAWIAFVFLLYNRYTARIASVLATVVPMAAGLAVFLVGSYFHADAVAAHTLAFINLRSFTVPASVLDHYYAFFSSHPVTYFCHISVLKQIITCPYVEQLGVVFSGAYRIGNLNGSLFATEGVAALGATFAPLGVFMCGIIIALLSSLSQRLTPAMVAVSSSVVLPVLVNVPLSTALLSNGLLLLAILWAICPPSIASE